MYTCRGVNPRSGFFDCRCADRYTSGFSVTPFILVEQRLVRDLLPMRREDVQPHPFFLSSYSATPRRNFAASTGQCPCCFGSYFFFFFFHFLRESRSPATSCLLSTWSVRESEQPRSVRREGHGDQRVIRRAPRAAALRCVFEVLSASENLRCPRVVGSPVFIELMRALRPSFPATSSRVLLRTLPGV